MTSSRVKVLLLFALSFALGAPAVTAQSGNLRVPWYDPPRQFGTHYLYVSVGGGRQVPVVFDTGSVGLVIVASAIGPRVTHQGIAADASYADGTQLTGGLATSTVTIAGVTTKPLTIQLIDHTSCNAAHPHCRSRGDVAAYIRELGGYGVIGVGMGNVSSGPRAGRIASPLSALPRPFNNAFVVTKSALILGPTDTNGFATLQLRSGGTLPTAMPAWWPDFPACITVEGTPLEGRCTRAFLDTGYGAVAIQRSLLNVRPRTKSTMRIQFDKAWDWSFPIGSTPSVDQFEIRDQPMAQIGRPFIEHHDVLYDLQEGRLGFRRASP